MLLFIYLPKIFEKFVLNLIIFVLIIKINKKDIKLK